MYGKLIIHYQGKLHRTVPLSQPRVSIGRKGDIELDAEGISGHHADIEIVNGTPILTDRSRYGTIVGGDKLKKDQPRTLSLGEKFEIGPYELWWEAEEVKKAPAIPAGVVARKRIWQTRHSTANTDSSAVVVRVKNAEYSRPTWPWSLLRDEEENSSYLQYLPLPLQQGDFLGRYLKIFESLWEPLEYRQDHIEKFFDADTCPAIFLPWLSEWLGLEVNVHWPETRLRSLLKKAPQLYNERGTLKGLAEIVQICTGLSVEILEDPDQPFVFCVRVRQEEGVHIEKEFIEDLINKHKPAYAGYDLEIV